MRVAGRHLKDLLAAHRDGDELAFRRAAQSLIEEEEAKKHVRLAHELRLLIAGGGSAPISLDAMSLPEPPKDRDSALPLADVSLPGVELGDLVLAPTVRAALEGFVSEVDMWPVFDAAGVPRRRRILLHGPPGCGKTSVAAALAGSLSRPLVTVRVDSVVSSFLGETATNLRRIFDFAAAGPFVVLLDEFDSLGKGRDDGGDHGELRRVVNAVLQLVDTYRGPSVLVAATNHDEVLDSALWRRFDEVLGLGAPSRIEAVELLRRTFLDRTQFGESALQDAVRALEGLPHAAVQRAAHDALRVALLAGRATASEEDLRTAVAAVLSRPWS